MRRLLGILFLLILFSFGAQAQNFKTLVKWADQSAEEGDYYGASLYYERAMMMDSTDLELLWKVAESFRKYNNYVKAEYYYERVLKRERGRVYPESAFWLATMQKHNGNYRDAIKGWKKFNRKYKRDKDSYYYRKSRQEMEACKWAREHLFDSVPVPMNNVGMPVNSFISEFAPFLVDSSTLLLSSLRAENYGENREVFQKKYHVQIYKSEKEGNAWGEPEPLDTTVNRSNWHQANGVYNGDGTRFYFSRCDDEYACGIWEQRLEGGQWTEPKALDEINEANTTHPMSAMIRNKEFLFFSSNRDGGQGQLDIWYTVRKENGKFGKAKNLGSTINTPDNEITPWYDVSSGIFYFSSQWHVGYGGFDVFSCNGTFSAWEEPQNMGYPFNTPANDYYFTYTDSSGIGFLASNRIGSYHKKAPTCCNDLYSFEMPRQAPADTLPYESLEELNKYLPVTLYFHNDEPDPNTRKPTTRRNYVDTWQEYTGMQTEYTTKYSAGLNDTKAEEAKSDMTDFFENYVNKGVKDLRVFTKLLQQELDRGFNIELTIQGYASPLAETDYNVHLTGRRISSLQNYLREYQGGALKAYMDGTARNGGTLTFVRVPFGEYTANKEITDNPNADDAIFSRGAALERKIEIVSVQQGKRDSAYAEMNFKSEIHDFGSVAKGDTLTTFYPLTNTGNMELRIDSIKTDCECLTVNASQNTVKAGARIGIELSYFTGGDQGLTARHFTIYTNATPPEKRLSITAEVMVKE